MKLWLIIWTVLLIGGTAIFAGLAIVVSIGAFFDVRSLFKSISTQHSKQAKKPEPQNATSIDNPDPT